MDSPPQHPDLHPNRAHREGDVGFDLVPAAPALRRELEIPLATAGRHPYRILLRELVAGVGVDAVQRGFDPALIFFTPVVALAHAVRNGHSQHPWPEGPVRPELARPHRTIELELAVSASISSVGSPGPHRRVSAPCSLPGKQKRTPGQQLLSTPGAQRADGARKRSQPQSPVRRTVLHGLGPVSVRHVFHACRRDRNPATPSPNESSGGRGCWRRARSPPQGRRTGRKRSFMRWRRGPGSLWAPRWGRTAFPMLPCCRAAGDARQEPWSPVPLPRRRTRFCRRPCRLLCADRAMCGLCTSRCGPRAETGTTACGRGGSALRRTAPLKARTRSRPVIADPPSCAGKDSRKGRPAHVRGPRPGRRSRDGFAADPSGG